MIMLRDKRNLQAGKGKRGG